MHKKYQMIATPGKLFRIRALTSFSDVKAGDLGGYIEKEDNLSHDGDCWVYDSARVLEEAAVYGHATLRDDAVVQGHALVCGNATISGYAEVYDHARVFQNASVSDYAHVCGSAQVYGEVCGMANVYGNSSVYSGAKVCDEARVCGNSFICDGVIVNSSMKIQYGRLEHISIVDLLRCSLGVHPVKGVVTLFKRVSNTLRSEHDYSFIYPESGVVECLDYDPNPAESCAKGLHFSTGEFWPLVEGSKYLAANINVDDIICVLEGKARVKRATIVDVIDYKAPKT